MEKGFYVEDDQENEGFHCIVYYNGAGGGAEIAAAIGEKECADIMCAALTASEIKIG